MTQIYYAVHRQVPALVERAKEKSIKDGYFLYKRRLRMLGKVERQRRYEEAVLINQKHGINPRTFAKKKLRLIPRRVKVSLAKFSI